VGVPRRTVKVRLRNLLLVASFYEAVDDYLEFCRARGEESDKPFSGKFVVRVSPDVHRKVYMAAKKAGMSINNFSRLHPF
jgi:predicted HicB family RNase H-like nuclease